MTKGTIDCETSFNLQTTKNEDLFFASPRSHTITSLKNKYKNVQYPWIVYCCSRMCSQLGWCVSARKMQGHIGPPLSRPSQRYIARLLLHFPADILKLILARISNHKYMAAFRVSRHLTTYYDVSVEYPSIFTNKIRRARNQRVKYFSYQKYNGPVIYTGFIQCLTKPRSKSFSVWPTLLSKHQWPSLLHKHHVLSRTVSKHRLEKLLSS